MNRIFFSYLGLYSMVYMLLCLIAIFLLGPLIDFIGTGTRIHLIVYAVLFLIVYPLLTRFIGDLIGKRFIKEEKE